MCVSLACVQWLEWPSSPRSSGILQARSRSILPQVPRCLVASGTFELPAQHIRCLSCQVKVNLFWTWAGTSQRHGAIDFVMFWYVLYFSVPLTIRWWCSSLLSRSLGALWLCFCVSRKWRGQHWTRLQRFPNLHTPHFVAMLGRQAKRDSERLRTWIKKLRTHFALLPFFICFFYCVFFFCAVLKSFPWTGLQPSQWCGKVTREDLLVCKHRRNGCHP